MFKIGEEVRFDKELVKRYRTNHFHMDFHKEFKNGSLLEGNIRTKRVDTTINREGNIIEYRKLIFKHDSVQKGIFCGYEYKKLVHKYDTSVLVPSVPTLTTRIFRRQGIPVPDVLKPKRLDDKYKLDKVAIIAITQTRRVRVPMSNLLFLNSNIVIL